MSSTEFIILLLLAVGVSKAISLNCLNGSFKHYHYQLDELIPATHVQTSSPTTNKCFVSVSLVNGNWSTPEFVDLVYGSQNASVCPSRCLLQVDVVVCCCDGDNCNSATLKTAFDRAQRVATNQTTDADFATIISAITTPSSTTTTRASTTSDADLSTTLLILIAILGAFTIIIAIVCLILTVILVKRCRREKQKKKKQESEAKKTAPATDELGAACGYCSNHPSAKLKQSHHKEVFSDKSDRSESIGVSSRSAPFSSTTKSAETEAEPCVSTVESRKSLSSENSCAFK